MVKCEKSFIKYLIFIFTLFLVLSGICLLVIGELIISDIKEVNHFTEEKLYESAVTFLITGLIVFITAIIGCIGTIRESYNLLITFAGFLFMIFIIKLAIGLGAAVFNSNYEDPFKTSLKTSMENYTKNVVEKQTWNEIHDKLQCCGVQGPPDWEGQGVPSSCCHNNEEISRKISQYCLNESTGKFMYQTGCYEKLKKKVNENTKILIGVSFGITFVEVIGVILACWLANEVNRQNK